jgi:arabinogalactan oligomer/maltooligosaccharide transport system substrate-binding protein
MSKKIYLVALMGLIGSFVLAACQPAATATEEGGETPEATEGTGEEATPETTEVATEAAPIAITFWHDDSGTEEEIDSATVASFMEANPNVTVDILAVPPDDIVNKFQTEAASGGGPTVIAGAQDRMAGYAAAGLLAEVPSDTAFLSDLVPAAVEGGKVGGTLYGVPINNKVLALFYNKSMVDAAPETWDDLLAQAADGKGLALTADWFHNYMWLGAFGADLFDENLKAVVDSSEGVQALDYLKTVCDSDGVTCDGNDGDMDTMFRQGEVAFRVQGPWASGDYITDLGAENVGVAKIPTVNSASDPLPWNQSDVISINANATPEEQAAALDFIAYMVSADIQAEYLNKANWIPANASVDTSTNPVVGGFLAQVPFSRPFPSVPELGATWDPMGNAVTAILEGAKSAKDALTEAATTINTANGK